MFQKKSFDLAIESDLKKSKKRAHGWLRFLVIPCLICFALLLILLNVDFSGNYDNNDLEMTTKLPRYENMSSTFISIVSDQIQNKVSERSGQENGEPFINFCAEIEYNKCKIKCEAYIGDHRLLKNELELKYKECNGPLDLTFTGTFEYSNFKKTDLNGDYILVNLTFFNCPGFFQISDYAFDKNSTKLLENLYILESEVERMTENTFVGLERIKLFKMKNNPSNKKSSATAVIKPMSKTLNELIFLHESVSVREFDPGLWLQGADLNELVKVDFQGNFFRTTLKKTSFGTLKNVKILNLNSCYIETLAADTFDTIMETLEFLDLRQNKLATLSSNFLGKLKNSNVVLNLEDNRINCLCNNIELITAIKKSEIKLITEPTCFSPEDVQGLHIRTTRICCVENELECAEDTTTTPIETTGTTTSTVQTSTTYETSTTESSIESYPTVQLECKPFLANEDTSEYDINDQLAFFEIQTITNNSVILTFQGISKDATLMYFSTKKDETPKNQSLHNTKISVNDLNTGETYIFCLVPLYAKLMSPFNCRAHHMGQVEKLVFIEAWLKSGDVALFATLVTIGTVIFLIIGLFGVYLLVRWRPTLLGENNYLAKRRSSAISAAADTSKTMSVHDVGWQKDSHEYVVYYVSAKFPFKELKAMNSPENLPPGKRAPALPPIRECRPVSTESTISTDHLMRLERIPEDDNEHEYQSIDSF